MSVLAAVAIIVALALSTVMFAAWQIALRTGRSGWIDAIWSFGVGAAGVVSSLVLGDGISTRQVVVAFMVAVWSLRLGLHIAVRASHSADDPRYAQLRRDWGPAFPSRLFWFLQVQAVVAFVFASAVFLAAHRASPELDVRDYLGGLILLVAIMGEALADRQLSDFRKDPNNKGKICTSGLWRFSRHPNYFFEWLAWTSYVVVAIDMSGQYPQGWAAIAAPVLMYWLLVHVSGIPPLEAHMIRSRGERFREYQHQTNAFWPTLPRPSSIGQSPGGRSL